MRVTEKEALRMLKEAGFEETHRKGSHIKFSRGSQRFIMTAGGWQHTGQLHAKQQKELLEIINNKETTKTNEQHSNSGT